MIDLDVPRPVEAAPLPPPRRWWWVLGLLVVLLVPGDHRPAPPAASAVLPDGTGDFVLDDRSIYVLRTAAVHDLPDVNGFDLAGDRLLAYRSALGTLLETSMFDLGTGRALWHRSDEPAGVTLWFCGSVICTGVAGPLVGRLDLETWRLTVLGRGAWTSPPRCEATARYLACRLDRIWIWPL